LIEAPELAACLTLSKNDFVRTGARGATYLAYRKATQEIVSRQLAIWGDARESESRPRTVRLERDLERVLEDLADDFPLLRSLVDHRRGGQKRLPLPGRGDEQVPGPLFASGVAAAGVNDAASAGGFDEPEVDGKTSPSGGGRERPPVEGEPEEALPPQQEMEPGEGHAMGEAAVGTLSPVPGRRRPARYGLMVQFESRPGDTELARLVDNTIWINEAHTAYTRALASRSVGYHIALSVALALAPLASDTTDEHAFITRFLSHWGSAPTSRARARNRRRGRT
jgi:hypothetical protein